MELIIQTKMYTDKALDRLSCPLFFVRQHVLENDKKKDHQRWAQWESWLVSPLVILFYKIVSKHIIDSFQCSKFIFSYSGTTQKFKFVEKKMKNFPKKKLKKKFSRFYCKINHLELRKLVELLSFIGTQECFNFFVSQDIIVIL